MAPPIFFPHSIPISAAIGAHAGPSRKAMATPAANARNDSAAITGTGGRGAAPPIELPMDMGADMGAGASIPAWPA